MASIRRESSSRRAGIGRHQFLGAVAGGEDEGPDALAQHVGQGDCSVGRSG